MIMKLINLNLIAKNDHRSKIPIAAFVQCTLSDETETWAREGDNRICKCNVYNCIYCVGRVDYSSNAGPRPNSGHLQPRLQQRVSSVLRQISS